MKQKELRLQRAQIAAEDIEEIEHIEGELEHIEGELEDIEGEEEDTEGELEDIEEIGSVTDI